MAHDYACKFGLNRLRIDGDIRQKAAIAAKLENMVIAIYRLRPIQKVKHHYGKSPCSLRSRCIMNACNKYIVSQYTKDFVDFFDLQCITFRTLWVICHVVFPVSGTKRFDSEKAGDREVQRTMLELLNQLDGFQPNHDIKVAHIYLFL